MNDELLPCPFCGGKAALDGFDAPEYWVWCLECKASTDTHTCKQPAIDAWNKRVKRYPESLAQRMIADGYEYELFELRKDYEHKLSELRQQLEKKQQTVSIVIEPGTELKEGQTLRVDDDGHVTLED